MTVNKRNQADLLLLGGSIFTQNGDREVISDGGIAISGDAITEIAGSGVIAEKYQAPRTIDTTGKYIFPGLINTHTHLFQTFMKGLGEGLPLYEWVNKVTAPTTTAMGDRDGYLAAAVGLMESLQSGTTTVLDYMYPLPSSRLYHRVADAFGDLGIRGILGWGFQDAGQEYGLPASLSRPVRDGLEDLSNFREERDNPLLTTALAPGITFGCSREGLKAMAEYAARHGLLLTVHVNETGHDDDAALKTHGFRNLPFLEDIGVASSCFIAVHGVVMREEDLLIMKRSGAGLSHNPVSNMYLGSGVAPVVEMRKAGIPVGLATDGAASNNSQDMLEVMKTAGLLHKLHHRDPSVITSQDVLDMATIEGARVLGMEDRIGSLETGKKADLFVFDPGSSRSVPMLNPVASLVFSSGREGVSTVIVGGRTAVENRRIVSVDEQEIIQEAQTAATSLARRVGTIRR